jgi:thiamine biosynthesis lipoprotein
MISEVKHTKKAAQFGQPFFRFMLLASVAMLILHCAKPEKYKIVTDGRAQGTTYRITILVDSVADYAADYAQILNDIDKSLSTYQSNSLISRINAGETNLLLDEHFIRVMKGAYASHRETKGAFDPTLSPLIEYWGFGKTEFGTLDSSKVDSMMRYVGLSRVQLDSATRTLKMPKGYALNFNASAQGYSVDALSEFLLSKGVNDFMVEVGGELRTHGQGQQGPWRIGIDKPDERRTGEEHQAILSLENAAVATSGNYRKFSVDSISGERYVHTLDPKSGYPVKHKLISATVISESCMMADAMATALLVMGLEEARRFLEKQSNYEAYLIYFDEEGTQRVYATPGFQQYLQ